ncbi:MAG TPA: peptide deformylase [Gemmatimonadaceae bacterium]|nr:peptide deformylase [Gemmatimonadaceae bacterium]
MSILDIRVLGDPILREETKPVREITDAHRTLIDDMFATMHAAHGIGLAAPQVGRIERIAVVDVEGGGQPIALVNPEIVSFSSDTDKSEEGCLSIPDVFADVERPTRVVVRALDRHGQPIEIEASDLLARCLQHEIDHLHGKLFIDYLSVLKRRSALAKWAKTKDRYPAYVRRLTDEEVAEHHRDEEL